MTDAMTERYPGSSFDPFFATFGNSQNIYTAKEDPERIDVLVRIGLIGVSGSRISWNGFAYVD
jgi:hypothetical protein